jgi:hypothetical protein
MAARWLKHILKKTARQTEQNLTNGRQIARQISQTNSGAKTSQNLNRNRNTN